VSFGLGDEGFYFAYANGEYMIRENGATWGDLNEGLRVDRGCKSAFPIEGEPEPAWEGIVEGIASWIQSAQ
jgi:hypothetical protein